MSVIPFPRIKTRAEQKLEWLDSLNRPLTDEESDELRRALHAVYCRNWRLERALKEAGAEALREHKRETNDLYERVNRESRKPEIYPEGDR